MKAMPGFIIDSVWNNRKEYLKIKLIKEGSTHLEIIYL